MAVTPRGVLIMLRLVTACSLSTLAFGVAPCSSPDATVELSSTVAVVVCDKSILRIVRTPASSTASAAEVVQQATSLMVAPDFASKAAEHTVSKDPKTGDVTIATTLLKAVYNVASSTLAFYKVNATGGAAPLLSEATPGVFTPTRDPALPGSGSASFIIEQSWRTDGDEGLYGGGQFQNGLVGFGGTTVQLTQYNTEAIVPFFSSTKGYGLLWDNNAWSYLNPPTSQPLTFKDGAHASFTADVDCDGIEP